MSPGPQHLVEIAIEPKSKADQEKLDVALGKMVSDDPSFTVFTDQESGQTIMKGMDEQQLDNKVNMLKRSYKVDANVGAVRVAYRESLGKRADIDYTYKKQIGGAGQFARVMITFEPGAPSSGFVFESKIVGDAVPKEFIPGVEKGLESVKESGLLAGFPLIDFKAILTDGKYHDADSSVLAFEIAARAAFRELREKGAPKILEPIMKVEVLSSDEYLGKIIEYLKARQGKIETVIPCDADQRAIASISLANMFGYIAILNQISQGSARFTMRFDHYAPVFGVAPDPDLFPPAIGMRA